MLDPLKLNARSLPVYILGLARGLVLEKISRQMGFEVLENVCLQEAACCQILTNW